MDKNKLNKMDKIINARISAMDETIQQTRELLADLQAQSYLVQYLILVREEFQKPDGKIV